MTSQRSTLIAALAALSIASIHCGARSSIESSQSSTAAPTSSSSSGASWTPQSLDGLVLWLDGTKGLQTSGGAVTSWEDQSGLMNDAAPADGGDPVVVANAIGGSPAVRFDGTNHLEIEDDESLEFGTGDFLIAVVGRHTTPIGVGWGYGFFYGKQDLASPFTGPALVSNTEEGTTQIAAQVIYHQAIIESAQSGLNDGRPLLLVMRRSASAGLASLELRLNGATSATGAGSEFAIDVSAPDQPVLIGGTPAMQNMVGDVAEVIAVKGTIPDADVTCLEGYLVAKYGL